MIKCLSLRSPKREFPPSGDGSYGRIRHLYHFRTGSQLDRKAEFRILVRILQGSIIEVRC